MHESSPLRLIPGTTRPRRAEPADAAGLAACHVAYWREAYAHLFSAAFLAALDEERRLQQWGRTLAFAPDGAQVVDDAVEGPVKVRLVR